MANFKGIFEKHAYKSISSVPEGAEGLVLSQLAQQNERGHDLDLVFVARDAPHMQSVRDAIRFFDPNIEVLNFPAWDCLPYDRVSPNPTVVSERLNLLGILASGIKSEHPTVLVTSVNAMLQRVPARNWVNNLTYNLQPGNQVVVGELVNWLEENGFQRSGTVRETGEYAVRGGILDLFTAGSPLPLRLDFFGDTLESLRTFDPNSQRTKGQLKRLELKPVSEFTLTDDSVTQFRSRYIAEFGAADSDDVLYQAVSEGRRYAGMEHWLPFFHDELDTIFDYIGDTPIVSGHHTSDAAKSRMDLIADHYTSRVDTEELRSASGAVPYKPIAPELLYVTETEWKSHLNNHAVIQLTPYSVSEGNAEEIKFNGTSGRDFVSERATEGVNLFDAVNKHIGDLRKQNKRVLIVCWSEGARERLVQVLTDHGLENTVLVNSYPGMRSMPANVIAFGLLGIESGFEMDKFAVIGEQDILGDRLIRKRRRERKISDFLTEASSLSEGDLIVHVEHGIGRFSGLRTIEAGGIPHDCLELQYRDGDRLFLPVENIELLSRLGAEDLEAQLDRLGSSAWQARKSKVKKRIKDLAEALIKTAAARSMRTAPKLTVPEGLYDEFAARFPFEETEDQINTIDSVFNDLSSGLPMDRLICGDVGFGKTEIALRAAFVAAFCGRQVAVVVPTTLLARQHFRTFTDRFNGLPMRIEHVSRLVSKKKVEQAKQSLAEGEVDIVIGTHALLGKNIRFRDLGLLVVDEEQHFGVKHKERLKELKADVHVLTLTATPIPRTLQLALTGVREMSIIATPPVDRLSIRTFVSPFDPLLVREALLRERFRGGQSFYVCPRVAQIEEVRGFLAQQVPELKVAVAHGKMPPGELDDVMNAFYDGKYDVLLSTTIVESGLDIPTVNTLIVHRSDMFGLSQLYQIRGRVGRSKVRAYALFTLPNKRTITHRAEKRLKILQSLETLGAGFQLATHDLDIRGSGNLLGEEQSGHIKEVGVELYQQMLEEAVAQLREGGAVTGEDQWSPQISMGTPVMIPESFVPDLQVRLSLYRRLGDFLEMEEVDAFGEELIDRFGKLPVELIHLLEIVRIKCLCRKGNVAKIDAGPNGVVVAFKDNEFANVQALVDLVSEQKDRAKLRPDHSLVFIREWPEVADRLSGTIQILDKLAQLTTEDQMAA